MKKWQKKLFQSKFGKKAAGRILLLQYLFCSSEILFVKQTQTYWCKFIYEKAKLSSVAVNVSIKVSCTGLL